MKVAVSNDPRRDASAALAALFLRYQAVPVLFLTSGGSALSLLSPEILGTTAKLTLSVLDEHYTEDPTNRNFEKLSKLPFYLVAKSKGATHYDPHGGAVESAGARFDAFLHAWMRAHPDGKVIATIGIGTDGHTAGIVPFSDKDAFANFFESGPLGVGYKAAHGPFAERVTSTFTMLRSLSDAILYAAGPEKADAIRTLLSDERPLHTFPAMFLKSLSQATLFTDIR